MIFLITKINCGINYNRLKFLCCKVSQWDTTILAFIYTHKVSHKATLRGSGTNVINVQSEFSFKATY